MRPTVGLFIFIFGPLPEHNLIVDLISMRDTQSIFLSVIFQNYFLLNRASVFPVRGMYGVKYHVSPKDKLSRRLLQRGMVSSMDCKRSGSEDPFPRVVFVQVVFLEFESVNDVPDVLVNSFNDCVCLRISGCDRLLLHTIII